VDLEVQNPFGHLPAETYPLMGFYKMLFFAYLAATLVWLALCLRQFDKILTLQWAILIVAVLCVIDTLCWWLNYRTWNIVGELNPFGLAFGVLIRNVKKLVSRALLLVVALGFGVVKGDLGPTWRKVAAVSAVYFAVAAAYDLMDPELSGHDGENTHIFGLEFLALPLALLDCIWVWWTFDALLQTNNQLKARAQLVKLNMYYALLIILLALTAVSALAMATEIIVPRVFSPRDDLWRVWWLLHTASWEVLNLLVLVAIMFIWRPSGDNSHYAFQELQHLEMTPLPASGKSHSAAVAQKKAADKKSAAEDYEIIEALNALIDEENPSAAPAGTAAAQDKKPLLPPKEEAKKQ
jgi:hypothetical protein